MKSVAQLRAAGFTVIPSTEAVGCTEVAHPGTFFTFNPNFKKTPIEIFEGLSEAHTRPAGGFRVTIASACPPDDGDIPLEILLRMDRERLAFHYRRHTEAQAEALRTKALFEQETCWVLAA
jgi:hypothetical protein